MPKKPPVKKGKLKENKKNLPDKKPSKGRKKPK